MTACTAFDDLLALTAPQTIVLATESGRLAVCPSLGGRVFAEVGGALAHRVDLATVAKPGDRAFNNYGGGTFWPAPEGGPLGFNYRGQEWYVQPAINNQPFLVAGSDARSVRIQKVVILVNRAGTPVHATMERTVCLASPMAAMKTLRSSGIMSYVTTDAFTLTPALPENKTLIAAWTLEQFDATPDTVSFAVVADPEQAINCDFYEHPGDRIAYRTHGLTYRTDGQRRGQIGIKAAARPTCIGHANLRSGLVCIRENLNLGDGRYFNIADNDQPQGPYSAADAYSLFNSGPDMNAFELETVGGVRIADGMVKGSVLVSATTLAVAANAEEIRTFIEQQVR